MFIVEKKLMDEGQRKFGFPFNLGDLLSHMIHLRRLCEPCVFTHTCKRKKENPRPLRPHPLAADSSATLHLINFYRGVQIKLDGGRRSWSKCHGISPLPLSAAYLHKHSRLWSTGVFCVIEPVIFLMEKVINLAKYSLISYCSLSIPVNQPAEITVDSFFF